RSEMAVNADKKDYRDYTWTAMGRFDYTPDDCLAMADAVQRVCVPMVEKLDVQRRERMKVDVLRPWDLSVDVRGRPPLSPFDGENPMELVERSRQVFARIAPELAEDFATLKMGRNLDLDSRLGKRAGGFQSSLEESGEPFIFMN